MTQLLMSKEFGEIEFEKTFVAGTLHIGKLARGAGYAHLSGHPVTRKEDGLEAISSAQDRDDFLFWWENKDSMAQQAPKRMILVAPNGDYMFDDGEPVTQAEQLIGYFAGGDALEQALRWFAKELVKREQIEKEAEEVISTKAGKAGAEKAKQRGPGGKFLPRRVTVTDHGDASEEIAIKD